MKPIKYGYWLLNVNLDETQKYYNSIDLESDMCSCLYCKNYIQYSNNMASELDQIFKSLGVQPQKSLRLSEYGEDKDKYRLYTGQYIVIGNILDGPINTNNWTEYSFNIDNYTFFISNVLSHKDFPNKTVFMLEFSAEIPWVIDEKPE